MKETEEERPEEEIKEEVAKKEKKVRSLAEEKEKVGITREKGTRNVEKIAEIFGRTVQRKKREEVKKAGEESKEESEVGKKIVEIEMRVKKLKQEGKFGMELGKKQNLRLPGAKCVIGNKLSNREGGPKESQKERNNTSIVCSLQKNFKEKEKLNEQIPGEIGKLKVIRSNSNSRPACCTEREGTVKNGFGEDVGDSTSHQVLPSLLQKPLETKGKVGRGRLMETS